MAKKDYNGNNAPTLKKGKTPETVKEATPGVRMQYAMASGKTAAYGDNSCRYDRPAKKGK